MALDAVKNLVKVEVSTGYDASATSVILTGGEGAQLPTAPFNMTWWNITDYPDPSDDPNAEIVRVTSRISDTLAITRAQENTSASTKNTSGKTYVMVLGITAKMITDIEARLRYAWVAPTALVGTINGSNTVFTIPFTPQDPASLVIYLAQQPQLYGVHWIYSNTGTPTATYVTAPEASLSGLGHYIQGQ